MSATKKDRPTRKRSAAAAARRQLVAETRAWRESILTAIVKARAKREKRRQEELNENPPPPAPEPRWVHQTAEPEWTRVQRRRHQLNRRSSSGVKVSIAPSSNAPYVNPARDQRPGRRLRRDLGEVR